MLQQHTASTDSLVVRIGRLAALTFCLALVACGGGDGGSSAPPPGAYTSATAYLQAENFVGTVLVRKAGVDVLRAGFGYADANNRLPNGVDTRFRIGSVTKPITALAITQLHEVGLIASLDDPLSQYLPDYPRGSELTIRHLLTHRSGIPDYLRWVNQDRYYTPAQLVALFEDRRLSFSPGERFSYSNSNYVLLGVLVETVSGLSWSEYLQVNVFGPLGMIASDYGSSQITAIDEARGYRNTTQSRTARDLDMSIPYAAGALVSTIGDLEIWGQTYLDQTLLSGETYSALYTEGGYGLGWANNRWGGKVANWHDGAINGFSAMMALFPEQDAMVILLSNVEDQGEKLRRIVAKIAENEL